jgi:hypothetical protein
MQPVSDKRAVLVKKLLAAFWDARALNYPVMKRYRRAANRWQAQINQPEDGR